MTAKLVFNGVDGASGGYLYHPSLAELLHAASGHDPDPDHLRELARKHRERTPPPLLTLMSRRRDNDPTNLAHAGWGVVFSAGADPAVKHALRPLLERRKQQASELSEQRYRELDGADAYRRYESKPQYLARLNVGPGPVDSDRLPYYLLVVGSPREIPFAFQYQLDVQHAVGRVDFESCDDYARYAEAVVAEELSAERSLGESPHTALFFGVENPDDEATRLSAQHLVRPLLDCLRLEFPDVPIQALLGAEATKAGLAAAIHGSARPSLLFTAGHGVGFPNGHQLQRDHQGALLCADWPGPKQAQGEALDPCLYFSADDVSKTANLSGLVAFLFACYGAGTPMLDGFPVMAGDAMTPIAPHAFTGRLCQSLLKAGALAAIGHVDRAWASSFLWGRAGQQLAALQSVIVQLLRGDPVGCALEPLNQRYAELSSDLTLQREERARRQNPELDEELPLLWLATRDARSYTVLGDPAVRLGRAPTPRQSVEEGGP